MSRKPVAPLAVACTLAALFGCDLPTDASSADPLPPSVEGVPLLTAALDPRARIAVDVDGNQHDKDDWAATPMILALLARAGVQSKVVHYGYNNHLGNNSASMASTMRTSVLAGADKFGFDRSKFYDSQTNLSGLIANLKKEIEASSSTNRLYILAAGPMEVLWRAVNASARAKRQYVTIISHSPWNNHHRDTPQLRHSDSHLKQLGIKWMQIARQEPVLHTRDWSAWTWLENAADGRLQWVHDRMRLTGKADVSDAGMCYYLLTSDQKSTPAKLRAFFRRWAAARLVS